MVPGHVPEGRPSSGQLFDQGAAGSRARQRRSRLALDAADTGPQSTRGAPAARLPVVGRPGAATRNDLCEDRGTGQLAFDSVMFRNWETGALYGVVPEWLKQQFAAGLSSLEDGFQEILPAGVGWSRALQEEAGSTSGRRAGGAASDREETTVIEPRSVE